MMKKANPDLFEEFLERVVRPLRTTLSVGLEPADELFDSEDNMQVIDIKLKL